MALVIAVTFCIYSITWRVYESYQGKKNGGVSDRKREAPINRRNRQGN